MTQIFVGNLAYNASEADVRYAFENYGRVTSVRMMVDASTNRSRGFAFVTMPSMEDAEEAIKHMSGNSLNGRQLTVNEAMDREKPGDRGSAASGGSKSARDAAMAMFQSLQEDE